MNRLLIALLGTFVSISAFASDLNSKLPENLVCRTTQANKEISSIEIHNLNTTQPTSNIPDTNLLDFTIDKSNYLVSLSFSNECDNSYGLIFFYEDLLKLKAKKLNRLNALLNYSDAKFQSAQAEGPESKTVSIECVAL